MKNIIILLVFLSLISSCIHKNKDEILQIKLQKIWAEYYIEDFDQNKAIDILIATTRKAKSAIFGCEDKRFGANVNAVTKFGICSINVPKNHIVGKFKLHQKNHTLSNDHFKIISGKSNQEEDLINYLKASNRTPLIFVHGFNVSYQNAILRAAQIAYDLKYQGPVILFTWPSGPRDGMLNDNLINQTYHHNLSSAKRSVSAFTYMSLILLPLVMYSLYKTGGGFSYDGSTGQQVEMINNIIRIVCIDFSNKRRKEHIMGDGERTSGWLYVIMLVFVVAVYFLNNTLMT